MTDFDRDDLIETLLAMKIQASRPIRDGETFEDFSQYVASQPSPKPEFRV